MASYIIYVALSCVDQLASMAFWSLTDIQDEYRMPVSPFHGGMGLTTAQGIPKASYMGLWMLSKLGDTVLARGDDWILTRRGGSFQLLLYQMAFLDLLAQQATDFSSEYTGNVYSLFEEKPAIHYAIALKNCPGAWRISRYELNPKHGSAYDIWQNMGSPCEMTRQEQEHLLALARPRLTIQDVFAETGLTLEALVPANGCQLLLIDPQ